MIEQPKNVRLAMPKDENALFSILSEELFNENGTFSLSENKARTFIHQAVNNDGGIIGVIEERGIIAGSIGLNLGTFWYSDDWHVEEYWNFVRIPYRNHIGENRTHYAKDLINFGKWISERMGLVLNIGVISNKKTEAKCRLYGRVLQPVGMFFMHNLQVAKGPGINKEVLVRI